jgi:hypothetical protein
LARRPELDRSRVDLDREVLQRALEDLRAHVDRLVISVDAPDKVRKQLTVA